MKISQSRLSFLLLTKAEALEEFVWNFLIVLLSERSENEMEHFPHFCYFIWFLYRKIFGGRSIWDKNFLLLRGKSRREVGNRKYFSQFEPRCESQLPPRSSLSLCYSHQFNCPRAKSQPSFLSPVPMNLLGGGKNESHANIRIIFWLRFNTSMSHK